MKRSPKSHQLLGFESTSVYKWGCDIQTAELHNESITGVSIIFDLFMCAYRNPEECK